MKTLAVLSTLAVVAIAAPSLPEAGQNTHQTKSPQDVSVIANEKSASPQTFNNEALHEIGNASPLQVDASHEPSARLHLGLKKPLHIKKKLGSSHLYRDSGEEQAQTDQQEQCMEEVKVKLCEAGKLTKTNKERSTITEDAESHMLDSDVGHSIKMAKEAVESLQRGLLNLEHKPDAKMSQLKHSNTESDIEIQQDIEVARQALEHIQQNFGNLESMNLRTATLKNTEHDNPEKKSETEEARLAKWKEAINNIQRNVEIAKNIENSFKSADPDITSSDSKTSKNMDTLDRKSELKETAMKSTEEIATEDKLNQHDADMRVSASSLVEVKVKPESKIKPLEKKDTEEIEKSSVTEEDSITEKIVKKEKSTESNGEIDNKNQMTVLKSSEKFNKLKDSEVLKAADKSEKLVDSEMALKSSEKSENFIDSEPAQSTLLMKSADKFQKLVDSEKALKSAEKSENLIDSEPAQSTFLMKSADKSQNLVDSESALKSSEKSETEPAQSTLLMKSTDEFDKNHEHVSAQKNDIEHEKSASAWKEPVENALLAKTSEHEKSANLYSTNLMKSADQVEKKEEHELNSKNSSMIQQFGIGKSAEGLKITKQPDRITSMKTADPVVQQNAQAKTFSHLSEPSSESSAKQEGMMMKAADETPLLFLGKSVNSDSSMQPSTHVEMKAADFPILTSMGKSVHLDSSKQPQMEMKAAEEKSSNKMLQWKRIHEARGAYGLGGASAGSQGAGLSGLGGYGGGAASAGLGGGYGGSAGGISGLGGYGATGGTSSGAAGKTGAVGVFPNANVGGCAIPLLLSCSPSVVSGSLAKSHPTGYGAPAYRMGEDFKYHFKRDTKKNNEIPSTKVKRTNTKPVKKFSLDKKF